VFRPVSLVVEYEEESHLIEVAKMLEGQLQPPFTAS